MKFLLLILTLLTFEARANVFREMETLIAADRSVNNARPLGHMMIASEERPTPASEREFMMMIQSWRRIVSDVKGNNNDITTINNLLKASRKLDRNNTWIAFNYLLNLPGNSQDKAKQKTKAATGLSAQEVDAFTATIDYALGEIHKDTTPSKGKDSLLVKIVGLETGEKKEAESNDIISKPYSDNEKTETLVTFKVKNEGKGIEIEECIAPHMDEFQNNPHVIYQRPVPALYVGEGWTHYQTINKAVPQEYKDKGIQSYYLYKFLLVDDEGNKMLYGLPSPIIEPNASLVPLARGKLSQNMKDQADKVSEWIKENNYLLPAMQHTNDEYWTKYAQSQQGQPPQEGIVIADVRIPGFWELREAKVYAGSIRYPQTPDQKARHAPGNNIFFNVPEVQFNNDSIMGIAPAKIAISYFRDKRAYGYNKQDGVLQRQETDHSQITNMLNNIVSHTWNFNSIDNLQDIINSPEPKYVLIRSKEDIAVDTPLGSLRKSNPNYWDKKNQQLYDQERPEIKDLFVLQTLYRWDPNIGKLIQVSIGFPEASILDRKVVLEKTLRQIANIR